MKTWKKLVSVLLAAGMLAGVLAGCGGGTTPTPTPAGDGEGGATALDLNVCVASEPQTMDPTLNQTLDGGMMFLHLFEGLYKFADNGKGGTVLVPGQAVGEPKVTANEDGTYTYSFTIRDDAKWSDGEPVKASDFVYSWRRLADPNTVAAYSYMLSMVVNANEITAGEMDPSQLAVSAPDDKTFEVVLTYNCPYFLEVCAFATCMPLREDVVAGNDKWSTDPATYLSNGPYKLAEWSHNAYIKMTRNEYYYDSASQGPDSITWKLMDDQRAMLTAFNNGELDYMQNAPVDEIATLLANGSLIPAPQISTYYACFNNTRAPFDDARVRKAFSLAIDRNYLVEKVTQVGEQPAGGWVPSNLYDVQGAAGPDFRTVGGDYISVDKADYEANCEEARRLLAEAGYPNGEGFPQVTYLYNTDNRHNAIAEALQQMWKTQLGVEVKLDNQDWNVFVDTRNRGDYDVCRNGWVADYNDPLCYLDMFTTSAIGGNNNACFSNERYDALIEEVLHTSDAEARMEMMHEAESILIDEEAAIAPLFFYTQPYLLSDRVQGMFYTPLGYFFFMNVTAAQ
jgi:oligopeptide transport system substrate-binding protein